MTKTFQVKSLEEMPRALTYLIEKVDSLQETVNNLRKKERASESPRWMNIDELCPYFRKSLCNSIVYKRQNPFSNNKLSRGLVM